MVLISKGITHIVMHMIMMVNAYVIGLCIYHTIIFILFYSVFLPLID
jgi:hypothetical protein